MKFGIWLVGMAIGFILFAIGLISSGYSSWHCTFDINYPYLDMSQEYKRIRRREALILAIGLVILIVFWIIGFK